MNSRRAVVDASAMVDLLIGSPLGDAVRGRLEDHELHAPAHFDAEVLSALGRLQRAGKLSVADVASRLAQVAGAPIRRHELASLLDGAWQLRQAIRLLDGLYVTLAARLEAPLITTDAALASVTPAAELIAGR
ncbi:MAG TPA: type II toxin-antitoxin system VapC family toxin [Thermoanaerobaculia bacterium]|jgi:predicted nucleic acid-binding protein|nr:type II toxin-antitoxin system VapC family toxin [Thermoanaerobaculia bacterium]